MSPRWSHGEGFDGKEEALDCLRLLLLEILPSSFPLVVLRFRLSVARSDGPSLYISLALLSVA